MILSHHDQKSRKKNQSRAALGQFGALVTSKNVIYDVLDGPPVVFRFFFDLFFMNLILIDIKLLPLNLVGVVDIFLICPVGEVCTILFI